MLLLWGHAAMAQMPVNGHWFTLQVPVSLTSQWQWHNDGGYRTLGNNIAGHQYFYRTGLRRQLGQHWSVAAGTALFFTRSSFNKATKTFGREFRCWQEVIYQYMPTSRLVLQARFRPEQRFFTAVGNQAAYYATRLRYRIAATQSLGARWQVQLADEYMHQARGRRFAYNQNRTMLGAIYQLAADQQLQLGYMWLQWHKALHQHITQFTFIKTIGSHANSNHRQQK
jgi:Protein of unknown function (DUF2490)